MIDLTAIILACNEEKNIKACIESISDLAKRIVVIDSGSTDKTAEIAKELGAEVLFHEWINYATQYNWGVENADVKTKWILRIDADERLTKESAKEIETLCLQNEDTDVNGIVLRFKVSFLGRDLKHGGIYPFKKLLVYKKDFGYMENRNMDEHILLKSGRSVEVKNDSLHYDFKDLTAWIDKHNKYSSREVLDFFQSKIERQDLSGLSKTARFKRKIKFGIYYKLPSGLRAHLYYIYRYYLKAGFLDGREGKIFAFLQAYWYRYLVDAKIYEKEKIGK
ncbi:MAG: glycosyltransferase family 2 protein [Clostridia bacterium]|nr:glycosyltransferase family 2 protein [Clostridia bacterium]